MENAVLDSRPRHKGEHRPVASHSYLVLETHFVGKSIRRLQKHPCLIPLRVSVAILCKNRSKQVLFRFDAVCEAYQSMHPPNQKR
jgi:hypothetical protein